MDIPPLAGKIAALSLGALPLSYALNYVSALSQCVRGGAGAASGEGGAGLGAGWVVAGREDARAVSLASSEQLPPGEGDLGQNYPGPYPT